jgi:putative DNA primase/helicase
MANNRIDAEALLASHPIQDVIEKYLTLKREGPHYKAACPFHDDKHASLTITPSKNLAKCFACGWSGDSIAFVMEYTGKSFPAACKEIDERAVSEQGNTEKRSAIASKRVNWEMVIPAPKTGHVHEHYIHGRPSRIWTYHTADGQIIGHVCRFDLPNGEKEVLPLTWCSNGSKVEWRWQGFTKPRPLYNLHLLEAHPNASVLMVEGEKTADASQANLDPTKTVVTTWPGGSMAISHIDWLPIQGRKVIFWPDNDVQGLSAMLHIRHLNHGTLSLAKIVPLDTTLPKGWDCADREWQAGELRSWVLERMVDEIPPNMSELWRMAQVDRASTYEFGPKDGQWTFRELKDEQPAPPEPPPYEEPAGEITFNSNIPDMPPPPPEGEYEAGLPYHQHFTFLGWNKDEGQQKHYFFQHEAKTTLSCTASSITKSTLITLAPLRFWETYFPGSKGGIQIDGAQEFIIRTSIRTGPFNDKYIRGRGAWVERDKVVIHRGTSLIVNGQHRELGSISSKFIYETSDDLGIITDNPLGTEEANQLIAITKLLNWEREINAFLLAGWCIVAPVCGALNWRPHIWLTGSAGTGKSWVFLHILRRLLGETALAVQGETSEAGLRQTLGHDAMPVVFDEADIDDRRSADRIQNILTLMRSASSDNGGLLLKGSATGQAKSYSIRSCFAFASIGVQAAQQADRSRITILGMKRLLDSDPARNTRWKELQRMYHEVVTDEFVQRLQARTVKLLPVILKNAQTFSNAAASVLGEQRTGDQLGALLAGAYSLFSNGEITYDAAVNWVKDKDWSEETSLQGTKDELTLLSYIMDHMVTVEGGFETKVKYERTIGELIGVASGKSLPIGISIDDAEDKLRRIGIKTKDNMVLISNSHKFILNVLRDTAWAKNHSKILRRLTGAVEKDSERFGIGVTTRAVAIPLSVFEE